MHSAYTNARWMRTNFSLVYISPCTFKCPIKITRQSSNSCDAGSHRCADETTARLNCPETRWRTPPRRPPLPPPAPRNLPFATLLGSKETYLSLHNPPRHDRSRLISAHFVVPVQRGPLRRTRRPKKIQAAPQNVVWWCCLTVALDPPPRVARNCFQHAHVAIDDQLYATRRHDCVAM